LIWWANTLRFFFFDVRGPRLVPGSRSQGDILKFPFKLMALSALMTVGSLALAQKGETVRIAVMDPMSGAFANMGPGMVRQWQYSADRLASKNPAGVKFEFGVFDNKNSPQESLNTFKAAVDQGYRQAQRAQSGQGGYVPQLQRSGPGADERKVRLLALPV
jgi:hypothetical protein